MKLSELPTGGGRFYQENLPLLPADTTLEHFIVRGDRPIHPHSDKLFWARDHVAVVILPEGRAYVGKSLLHPADAKRYNRKLGFNRAVAQAVGRAVIGEYKASVYPQHRPYQAPVRLEGEKAWDYRCRIAEWLSELGVMPHGEGQRMQEEAASRWARKAVPL